MPDRDLNGDAWTLGTLRKYLEAQLSSLRDLATAADRRWTDLFSAQAREFGAAITGLKDAVTTALAAAERASNKAEAASDKRFDAGNEFRQSLDDQSRLQMPRTEAIALLGALTERINKLETAKLADVGRTGGIKDSWAMLAAVAALIVSIGAVIVMAVHK